MTSATDGAIKTTPSTHTLLAAPQSRSGLVQSRLCGASHNRDLRSLLAGLRLAKQTAVQTAVRLITTGILFALMAGIAIKLKLFGPSP